MKEKIRENVKEVGRAISDWIDENDREIVGFLRGVEIFFPFTLTGVVCILAASSKHPRKYLSKDFVKKILNDKEEG